MSSTEATCSFQQPKKVIVATCDLNLWALDFEGNFNKIVKSILVAKEKNAKYRLGPELEITGYNCQDHFFEMDTIVHTYEALAGILSRTDLHGIVIDIGLPLIHNGVRYNCRAVCYNGKIICIRPKTVLANDGMYHEERWFVAWRKTLMEEWFVPEVISNATGQALVPIGVCILKFKDVNVGIEMCEELFVPNSLHNLLALNGADIIFNGSGSHFELNKLVRRFGLVSDASGKAGCAYVYSNLVGCDGSTYYFDGGSFVSSCGNLLAINKRFTINSGCEVLTAVVNVDEMRAKRGAIVSWSNTAAASTEIPKIIVNQSLCTRTENCCPFSCAVQVHESIIRSNTVLVDEMVGAPVCYLWDYLKRSGCSGFFVALSGGADSSCVAALVYYLCYCLHSTITSGSEVDREAVLQELRKVVGDEEFAPTSVQCISKRLIYTAYMSTANSSSSSKSLAERLSSQLGTNHYDVDIGPVVDAVIKVVSGALGMTPRFRAHGGTEVEDLALQNIQARLRLSISYVVAQLAPASRPRPTGAGVKLNSPHIAGSLLVLGTANADESVRGYFTKYDNSSGDLSPISNLGKGQVNSILDHLGKMMGIEVLQEIRHATPTAELVPLVNGQCVQNDEEDMGMSYEELSKMRYLRNTLLCGPLSMFYKFIEDWKSRKNSLSEEENRKAFESIANKVKKFFVKYGNNRHKIMTLPPEVHLSSTAVGGKVFDMRPFLYNPEWKWQFKRIDRFLDVNNQCSGTK